MFRFGLGGVIKAPVNAGAYSVNMEQTLNQLQRDVLIPHDALFAFVG